METNVPDTFGYLFLGYSVIWIVLAGYIISLVIRLNRLERSLAAKLDERPVDGDD